MAIDMERLLDSVRSVESGGNRFAISEKGAQGPYQFMPDTAREFGVNDPFDERQARDGARRKMSGLLKQYNGDLNQALAAWNFGQGNLSRTGMGRLPPETQGFVRKVNGLYGAVTPAQPLAPARPTQQFSLAPGEMAIRQRIADGLLSNDRSSDALKTSVLNPLPTDKAKRIYDMQLKTGLPVGVIERNLDEIERKSREKGFDAEKFRRESPLLAKWLAKSPAHSALAQYDFTSLQNLENAWNLFASGGSQGFKQSLKGELTYKLIQGTITPQEEQERQRLKAEIEKLGKPYEEGFPSWLFQAANVVGMQIPLAAEASKKGAEYGIPLGAAAGGTLGLIGGPGAPVSVAAGAAIGGGIGYGKFAYGSYIEQTYHQAVAESFDDLEEAKDANGKRIDPVVARYAALLVGMPNAILEFASLRQAVKLIPGADKVLGSLTTEGAKQILARPSVTAALADISKKYAVAVGTETFTEGMQKVATIFARELAMGGAGTGITKEDVQATGKEMAMAFKGAAVLGGLASGPKIVETYVDIQRAARNEAFMRNLGETVQQSKMSASSPEAMGGFVAELKKDGPIKNVYVSVEDWNTVFQSAAPQAAQEVFGSADQYNEATTVGGDIVIPIDLYAGKVAATPFHEKLVPYVKLDVYDMTPTQAQEVIENEKDLIELANLDAEATIEQQKPLTAVYNDVYAKLRSIGQTPQRANREALLTRHRIQARAERLGLDPLVLYNEQPMTVTRVLPEKLKAYNQQLAEPAVPFAPKLPLPEGELGLEPATEQEAKAAAEAISAGQASFDEFGVYGATVHPVKGNLSGTPGVAVAGYPQRGVVTEGAPTKEEAEAFMVRNRDIFQADPNAALGIWVDNDTGKGYLDITNALPREDAVAQGEYLGELAVWDLEHFEEIRLPVQRDTGQQVLFQEDVGGDRHKEKRGASVPTKNLIALFERADPSTFLHESGHIWLEELRLDAQRPDAPAQLKADWEIAKQWIGATDEKISTKAHEKFARGVEKYVMEGHIPSAELRDILTQFKDWLFRIYKNMSTLDVELTPEVVGVMDRLLATDEAIAQAREQTMADAAILTGEGMTNAEYQAYLESIKDARFRAENEFRIQVMKEMKRERLQEWREKRAAMAKQVEQDVLELPIYRVAYWLWHGKLPDGTVVEGLETRQLDMQAVLDLGVVPTKLGVRVQKNGIHPDVLAKHFGYPSGEALVRELVGLKPLKKMVDDIVDTRMKQEHGDLMTDGTMSAKALLTAHGPKTTDVLAYELKILKRIGAKRSMADPAALKHIAHQIIQRKRIGDLHPAIYAAAARRAAEEALIAKRDNNLDQTFDSKQRQLLNLYLLKEATERRLEIDKSVKKWKTFLFRSDKRLAKSYNMDLVNAARSIAAIHGIGGAEKMPADYLTQLQEYDPQTYANIKDLVALAAADGRPIDDMPVSDFETVKDAIEGLWFLARRTRQHEVDGKLVDRDQVIGELSGTMATLIPPGTKRRGYHKAVTRWEQAKIGLNSAKALLTRTEFWVDLMDSGDPLGAFRRNIWNPVSEAADEFRVKRIEYLNKYAAIVNRMSPDMFTAGQIDATEYFDYVFSSKMELLGAMLHTGNESNFQKLLYGREWAGIADGELDSTNWDNFIKKMQDTGVLTKNDYDFVQSVWDLLEEMKPAAQKTHRQLFGYYFDEITARPFTTPFGTYKGGYFPATVDPFAVEDVAIRQELEAVEQRPSSFIFPSTGKGFTQLRNERYRRPLSLDLGLTQQHIEKVLRFTYLEPHIQDVGRVVTNRDFRANLALLDAEVGSVMLVPWLQRTALQQTEQPSGPKMRQVSAALHWMRTGAGMQVLAANFTNFLQQFTGFSLGAIKVKPRYMAGALFRYLSSPKDYARMIAEASPMMSTRLTSAIMDIKRNIDDITMNPNVYQKARAFSNQHAYFLSTASQHVVDLVVWGGAYDQAITDGADETMARRQADSAVRQTQGSFNPEDISRAEAGTAFHKMFTMFYGYFNMAANLNATEFAKAMRQQGYNATGRLLYVYTFAYMIPAVISELIVQAMSGELFDDDDDDGYLDNLLSVFFGGQVRFGTAMVPFLGQAIQVGINTHNDKWYDDRINLSPAVSAIEAGGRVIFGRDAYLLAAEEDVRMKRPVQDLLTTIGMVTNLPVGPLGRPVGYMLDVEQGYTEPESAVEMTRGLITGKTPQ